MGISEQISEMIIAKTDFTNDEAELATENVINASARLTRAGIAFETAADDYEAPDDAPDADALTAVGKAIVLFAANTTKPEMSKEDRQEMVELFSGFFTSNIPGLTEAGVELFGATVEIDGAIDALNALQNEV